MYVGMYVEYRLQSRMSKLMKTNLFALFIIILVFFGMVYAIVSYPLWALAAFIGVITAFVAAFFWWHYRSW